MLGPARKETPLGALAYLNLRSQTGQTSLLPEKLMRDRFQAAPTLFRKDLKGHFGCVNAIEFSSHGGEWLASGGDDRRVLVWNTEAGISGCARPTGMKGEHHSNIFCLAFDNSNTRIFSGGNDEQVIVHDLKTGTTLDVFNHEDAVYGLSVDPVNDNVFASACDDGRILIYDIRAPPSEDPFCLANYMAQMHAVVYNPVEPRLLATANSTEGIGLWDVRRPRSCLLRYGGSLSSQSCMSVRINRHGDRLIALRRRLPPVLYDLHSSLPVLQFDHAGYYNSCTMKSCCFAGDDDQYLISGSDDFNLYAWKIPEEPSDVPWVGEAHLVLRGHRSIVNQVRFNPANHLVVSSGVEKVIKIWSPFEMPDSAVAPYAAPSIQSDPLATVAEAAAVEASLDERPVYTQEEYYNLLLRSGQVMSHDYSHQSTEEDPRMMAFFDALVQRELEGFSSDDSLDSSSQIMLQFVQPSDSEVSIVGDNTLSDGSRAASPRPSLIATTDSSAVVSSPGNHGAEPDLDNDDEETEGSSSRSLLNMDELLLATRRARLGVGNNGVQGNINVLASSSSIQGSRNVPGSSTSVASASASTHTLPGQRLLPTRPSISELITLKRKEYLSNARKVDQLIRRRHAKSSNTKRAQALVRKRLENTTTSSSSTSSNTSASSSSSSSESSSSDSSRDCDNKNHKNAERASRRRAKKRPRRDDSSSESSPERPEGLAASAVAQLRNKMAESKRMGFQRLKQMRTRSLIRSNSDSNSDDGLDNASSATATTERILQINNHPCIPNGNGENMADSSSRLKKGIPSTKIDRLSPSQTLVAEPELHCGNQEPTANGASTSSHMLSTAHEPNDSKLNDVNHFNGSKDGGHHHSCTNNNNNNHTNDSSLNGFDQASVSGTNGTPVFKFKRFSVNKERSGRKYRRRTSKDNSSGNEAS